LKPHKVKTCVALALLLLAWKVTSQLAKIWLVPKSCPMQDNQVLHLL
jgi:hypothetical protein